MPQSAGKAINRRLVFLFLSVTAPLGEEMHAAGQEKAVPIFKKYSLNHIQTAGYKNTYYDRAANQCDREWKKYYPNKSRVNDTMPTC